ncbi:MAG TPA: M48 family metalloprotease [Usitatibacter sp.]|nr:M48 family metalloprotease [Usitatibacter sp.]
MRKLVFALLLAAAVPASAQFDLGRILNKAIDTGKKLQEANRDFTTEEEIDLGSGITASFLGATRLHPDAGLQRYVNRVGKWVAMHSERPELPWSFGVIDTQTINAFAMPGGSVLVTHGLLRRLQSESELAAVLAHEIAHVVKKHQLSAIQSSLNSDVLAGFGREAAGRAIARRGDVAGLGTKAANVGVDALKNGIFLRPLDRSMEYDADRMAVVLATRSGYDPYGLVAVLQMLSQSAGDDSGISVFETHPSPQDRLGELESFVPAHMERYAGQPQNEARFRQVVGPAK